MQYTVLGKSEEELCEEHDISPALLSNAARTGGWSAPTTNAEASADDMVVDADSDAVLEKLQSEAVLANAHHQATLLPKYIAIENAFLKRLKERASEFEFADEAKKIAETLSLIKPNVMKHAESEGNSSGGNRIMIVNKFPVPQPGDDGYIAPNAVLVAGAAAGLVDDVVGTDYSQMTIELPTPEELN